MAEIFWLASYPKSGNTWLRILLANIRAGGEADIDDLAQYGLSGAFSRIVFDQYCGFKSSNLPVAVCECLRPQIFRVLAAHVPIPQVLKVHDAWRLTPKGEPLFPLDVSSGAICVVRNVLDVAPSAADHWAVNCAEAVRRICDADFALMTNPKMLAPGLRQFMGTWSDHIASWVDRSGLPLLVVRYEDLMADADAVLTKVLTFLGWSADDVAIRRAVEASGFARLQQRECDRGFRERPPHAHSLFFRRGQVGSWRDELAPDLVRKLIDGHGTMMRRFGYLDDKGNPT
jgi:aryl sulfotransferase